MTADEFKAAQQALGLSDDAFAEVLGLTSGRGVRAYKYRERPISGPVEKLVRLLLQQQEENGRPRP